jgi:hypothetical protein
MTTFIGADVGDWHVKELKPIRGESIPSVSRLQIEDHPTSTQLTGIWKLCGFVSNIRYANQSERKKILAIQEGLGRPQATCAALIPIRKNEAWWNLAQDERRAIFEEQSHHTAIGLQYLPAIPASCIIAATSVNPSIFLRGLSTHPKMPLPLRNW